MPTTLSPFRKPKPTARRSVRPTLEALERRDCPAAPTITSLSWNLIAARQGTLSGYVTDESPQTTTVTFGGKAGGSVTPNAQGFFSLNVEATGLGDITAVARDQESLTSNTASTTLTSNAPSLTLTLSYGAGNQVTLSGYVNDEWPGGRDIVFTGKVAGTANSWSDGHFTLTANPTELGSITATTTDVWGQTSQPVTVNIINNAPVIQDFGGSPTGDGDYWEFEGRVVDESAQGLTVQLGGLPSLAGKTATVGADGWFSITVLIPISESGTAWCKTKDWFNQDSNTATWLVRHFGFGSGSSSSIPGFPL